MHASRPVKSGQQVDAASSLPVYVDTVQFLAWVAVGVGIVVLAASPWLFCYARGVFQF